MEHINIRILPSNIFSLASILFLSPDYIGNAIADPLQGSVGGGQIAVI
jgi:hypothetical protein